MYWDWLIGVGYGMNVVRLYSSCNSWGSSESGDKTPCSWTGNLALWRWWGFSPLPKVTAQRYCYRWIFFKKKKNIGGLLIYNLVLLSGVKQSDSVTQIFNLFQILFPYRLLQNIEYRRSCSVIYFLYWLCVYVHLKLLMYPSAQNSPLVTISLFSNCVSLFLFCK